MSLSDGSRLKERIQSHVLLNWLALLIFRIVELQTEQTCASVRRTLDQINLGHFYFQNDDLFQQTELTHEQHQILRMLEVEAPPKIFDIQIKC